MSAGAVKDYGSVQKEHWRRWAWNEVLSRTKGREQHEVILYLLGSGDHDRRVALEKGVPNHNLIGIDRDGENVARCREAGGLAVQAEVGDVLWAWPSSVRVCAVFLDYCSGIEWTNRSVLDAFQLEPLVEAAVMLNLMRGRDAWANRGRAVLDAYGLLEDVASDRGRILASRKSRPLQMMLLHALEFAEMVIPRWVPFSQNARAHHAVNLLNLFDPVFHAYPSGALWFDSVVCTPTPWGARLWGDPRYREPHEREIQRIRAEHEKKGEAPPPSTLRRIAATLAHRTRRKAA